jgi:single-stranded-DNA-specific exonuclease
VKPLGAGREERISGFYMWRMPEEVPPSAVVLYEGLPRWLAQMLWNRGLRTRQQVDVFLNGKGAPPDPGEFEHMDRAVNFLSHARSRGHHVLIYGDYDVDGVTATALLLEGFSAFGLKPEVVIPSRADGYGLRLQRLEHLPRDTVLVAVDCGVSEHAIVAALQRRSVNTVVIDHHQLPDRLPPAGAILHPELSESRVPFSSVGLAFQLIRALSEASGSDLHLRANLDLVALGTLADMAPLVSENRRLVRYGLAVLRRSGRPGLQMLLARAGLNSNQVNSRTAAFHLAPRLNAPGRISDAQPVLELLTTRDGARAAELAELVETHNLLRKEWFSTVYQQALPEVRRQLERGRRCVVLAAEGWPPGLMGLLAARVVEEFWTPAVALAKVDGTWRGSIRTPTGVSAVGMLRSVSSVLLAMGGHEGAGGLTLAETKLPDLARGLEAAVSSSAPQPRVLQIDARVSLSDLDVSLVSHLARLDPFGEGNPEPLVVLEEVILKQVVYLSSGAGVRVLLGSRQGYESVSALAFGRIIPFLSSGAKGDAVLRIRMPKDKRLDLELIDFKASVLSNL